MKRIYKTHNGISEQQVEADAVSLTVNGATYELTANSKGEVSISVNHGMLIIRPKACNAVELQKESL